METLGGFYSLAQVADALGLTKEQARDLVVSGPLEGEGGQPEPHVHREALEDFREGQR